MTRNHTQTLNFQRYSLQGYLTYHGQAALASFMRLIHSPMNSVLTTCVIAIAIALPAGLFVLLQNIDTLSGSWQRGNQISLYLKIDIKTAEVDELVQKLKDQKDIASINRITPEEGLKAFEQGSGFASVLQHLPNNPIPTVIEIFPDPKLSVAEGIPALFSELQKLPQVDMAKLDMQWLQRLQSMVDLAERFIIALSLFFGVAVLLIIGNTIRLATQQQHREIEIIKLIGATQGFIRRPFLYTGFYFGFFGSLLACIMIQGVLMWLERPIEELFSHYHSHFNLIDLSSSDALIIILLGALLGLCGSWLAVNRQVSHF